MVIGGTTPLALAGCEERLSAVHPAGPAADIIATLWWVMLGGAAAIFLLVAVLLVLAFRRGEGPADAGAESRRETVWIKGLGLGFTMAVLAALTAWGLWIGEQLLPRSGPDVVAVEAEGRQWSWRFSYPDTPGRVTESTLHIPARRPVDVRITSTDVIHSFWVPRLAGKLDAIPGHVNVLRIEASEPGEYAGVSAEFSGAGYRSHDFTVVAHDEAAWNAFLAGETP
jgi:heme/copper-type cytochrome/quinol oxidase subunit 2